MNNGLSELSNRIDEAFNAQEYGRAESLFEGFKALVAKELDVKGVELAELSFDALEPVDQVAAMFLQGLIANEGAFSVSDGVKPLPLLEKDILRAYVYADAFMAERSRRGFLGFRECLSAGR